MVSLIYGVVLTNSVQMGIVMVCVHVGFHVTKWFIKEEVPENSGEHNRNREWEEARQRWEFLQNL